MVLTTTTCVLNNLNHNPTRFYRGAASGRVCWMNFSRVLFMKTKTLLCWMFAFFLWHFISVEICCPEKEVSLFQTTVVARQVTDRSNDATVSWWQQSPSPEGAPAAASPGGALSHG